MGVAQHGVRGCVRGLASPCVLGRGRAGVAGPKLECPFAVNGERRAGPTSLSPLSRCPSTRPAPSFPMLLHLALPVRCGRPPALPARSPATSLRRGRPLRTAPAPPHATPGGDAGDDDLSPSSAAALRAGPLSAGCVGIAGVLLNRVASGVSLKKKRGWRRGAWQRCGALVFFFLPCSQPLLSILSLRSPPPSPPAPPSPGRTWSPSFCRPCWS